jgi:hypothetical protein
MKHAGWLPDTVSLLWGQFMLFVQRMQKEIWNVKFLFLLDIQSAVLEMKHTDSKIDITYLLWTHFMHFMQRLHKKRHPKCKTSIFLRSYDTYTLWPDLLHLRRTSTASGIQTSDSLTQKISDNLKTRGSGLVTAGAALTMAMPKTKTECRNVSH